LVTTGSNVYQSRVYAIHTGKLPALFVYTSSEQSERIGMTPMTYERTVTVNVEAVVHAGENYDDTLDTICKEVEVALQTDLTRNSLAKDTRIVSFESEFSDQADKPLARGTIQVEVDYYTLETDPETAV
jgi:hypothetical protein